MTTRHAPAAARRTKVSAATADKVGGLVPTKTCGAPLGEGRRVVTLTERVTTNGTSLPRHARKYSIDPHGRCPMSAAGEVPRPTSVYRYYDQMGVLIYVGITRRGVTRNLEHNLDKEWWPYVATQEVDHYPSKEEALRRERDLIRKYEPPFNVQHNPNHAGRRADYLGVAPIQQIKHASHLYVLLKRAIPLFPFHHDIDAGDLVMRTHVAHQLIATGLVMPQSRKVPSYVINESKKGYLRLLDITQDHGKFTLLHFKGPRDGRVPPAEGGKLAVKLIGQKKPVTFSIEKITLVRAGLMAESA